MKSDLLNSKGLFAVGSAIAVTAFIGTQPGSTNELSLERSLAQEIAYGNPLGEPLDLDLDIDRSIPERSLLNCDPFENPNSFECLGPQKGKLPSTNLERIVQKTASYISRFVPLLNSRAKGSDYFERALDDGRTILIGSAGRLANNEVNDQINKIPFLEHTNVSFNAGGSDLAGSISLNSLIKLKEMEHDQVGDLKSLLFSQARFNIGFQGGGTTRNLGLGIRRRPNDFSMIGGNVFWDYRTTTYSTAHSRLGVGGEYLWKDFEFRNNWYMTATEKKTVTIGSTEYTERVVPGWDVEIGYRLPDYPELAVFVRGFNWDYRDTQDNSGIEGSLNWQATPKMNIEAWISNEISATTVLANTDLPRLDETFFGLRLKITGKPVVFKKKNYKENMISQMTQPVRRRYDVLLERSSGWSNRAKGS